MNNNKQVTNWINCVLSELSDLNDNKGIEILNKCGNNCCEMSDLYNGAIDTRTQNLTEEDTDKLFNDFKSRYYNSDNFTKNKDCITLILEKCTCSLVKNGVSNSYLCNCTIGYSKKLFETLFDKKVKIDLEKSILRGDSICKQTIKILE